MARSPLLARLERRLAKLEQRRAKGWDYARYADDPCGFCRDVLKMPLTPQQEVIARACVDRQGHAIFILVESGHSVGKSFLVAALIVWWFFTRPVGAAISTAPTKRDVEDVVWGEVRRLIQESGLPSCFPGDSAPLMRTGSRHYAKGFTAGKKESFVGRHLPNQFFALDEAEGLAPQYTGQLQTMMAGDDCVAVAICNPTTTNSPIALERKKTRPDGRPKWLRFQLSCLDHPNVAAGLRGRVPPFPGAITVEQLEGMIADYCDPLPPKAERHTDIQWPPAGPDGDAYLARTAVPGQPPPERRWYRPGPDGEARILGRRPTSAVNGIWSDAIFAHCLRKPSDAEPALPAPTVLDRPQVGSDIGHYGTDWTAAHTRCGPVSWEHDAWNGADIPTTVDRLVAAADRAAGRWNREVRPAGCEPIRGEDVPIVCDDTGVGCTVGDFIAKRGYRLVRVQAGSAASLPRLYRNTRSELWFATVKRAGIGGVHFGQLPPSVVRRLEQQLIAPTWFVNAASQREVESKDETRKTLKRSPDDADAVNLAFREVGAGEIVTVRSESVPASERGRKDDDERRGGFYGRG